ncbi:MAG: hypothetical protein COA79_25250 [Planctomycetota bacterium]|nr:MAG: hypothetical protein COA79_25250 [Planctomycetota bacterium]
MNVKTNNEKIKQRLNKLKNKKLKKGKQFSKEEILSTKVSVIPTWQRVLTLIISFSFIGFGITHIVYGSYILFSIFFSIGLAILVIGIFGGKKSVGHILEKSGDAGLALLEMLAI